MNKSVVMVCQPFPTLAQALMYADSSHRPWPACYCKVGKINGMAYVIHAKA